MPPSHRVYIPALRLDTVFPLLATAFKAGPAKLVLEKPLPGLQLAGLRCFHLAVMGSSWRVRTPYVYPLLSTEKDLSFPERHGKPLERFDGVDWVMLGGDPKTFTLMLGDAARRNHWETIRVIPFLAASGPLPQERQESDVPVLLFKKWYFVNHLAVAAIQDQLLALPEERWPETGYVAVNDHFGLFAPFIERYLAKPPALILELGCGLGQMTRSLAARFPEAKVVGLDVSRESLDVAREKFRLPNLEYRVFDFANRFALDTGSADLIVSSSALNISDNQARTAGEVFRVLSPEGLLVNGCIFEPFHTYWDFPRSALRPTHSNLLTPDWKATAERHGKGMTLHHWTGALSSHYFTAAQLDGFDALYRRWLAEIDHTPLAPYDYPQCTGFMTAGGLVPQGETRGVPPANHLEAVGEILGAYARASETVRDLSELNWMSQAALMELFPEALEYLAALLPGAAGSISQGLLPLYTHFARSDAA